MKKQLDRTNAPHHVYRCYDAEGRLVYVGSSGDLFGRLATHNKDSWWAPQVKKVVAKSYPNGVAARAAEREAIATELPRWNKAGKWRSRDTWTRANWDDWLTTCVRQATFPDKRIYSHMDTYRLLWGAEPDMYVIEAMARLEYRHSILRAEVANQIAENEKRRAQLDREDELALRREQKEGAA